MEKARAAQFSKWEQEVDPERELPEAERKRRAENARKAYMLTLALRSSRVRSKAGAQK
jgi:hypothetical protein